MTTSPKFLSLFTIYNNPSDYPGKYVVRVHVVETNAKVVPEKEPRAVVNSLEEARSAIPPGMVNLHKHNAADDPCIVETWI